LSDFFLIDFSPVAYSQDKDILSQNGKDHPVITDSVLSKTGESPFKNRIGICLPGKFFLNLIQNTACLFLGKPLQITMD